jgi:transcriptional regulator with XRE-family HTH domain
MKTQGSRIRAARHSAGMTQAALAHAAGTRERNIIRWENDQNQPRFEHVAAIARVTGKDVSFFTVEDDEGAAQVSSLPSQDMFATLLAELMVKSGVLDRHIDRRVKALS